METWPKVAAFLLAKQKTSERCSISKMKHIAEHSTASSSSSSSSFWFLSGAGDDGEVGCCSCLCIPVFNRRRHQAAVPKHSDNMMQMFYYENTGTCCKRLLRYNGYPYKVLLYPEEGWAHSASTSYLTLTPAWWSRSRCKVVEVAGTRRYSTQAKLVDTGTGSLYIIGSFKRMASDPDFKLYLTSNVSVPDFNMGYSMTGTLERGNKKNNFFQITHFAVIRRHDHEKT